MKKKNSIILLIVFILVSHSIELWAQVYTQPAHVSSQGGKSGTSGIYSHFCVVGEPVVKFNIQSGNYTGSVGFLPNASGGCKPVASVVPSETEVAEGSMITLDASSSYDPDGMNITFQWTSNGSIDISNPSLPMITIAAPQVNYKKSFTVSVVIDNGICSDTAEVKIHVYDPKWQVIVAPNSTICISKVFKDCAPAATQILVGAFIQDTCRGIANIIPYQGNSYVSFLIQYEFSNQQIEFILVDTVSDDAYFSPLNLAAKTNPGGFLGTFANPFTIESFQTSNHEVMLPVGWSGISSSIAPVDNNIENMFLPVEQSLTILYNSSGIYNPGQGINTLGNWQRDKGFVIKMTNESTLDFEGYQPCSNSLSLTTQWSIMPVLSNCQVPVSGLFSGQNLKIIKEVAGHRLYWPQYGINTLVNLSPGKSYYVYMNGTGTVNFPQCTKSQPAQPFANETNNRTTWAEPSATPVSHTIAFPEDVLQPVLSVGDFIGAFTQGGICCGIQEYSGGSTGLIAFADDPATAETEGFAESEGINLRIFKTSSNEEFQLTVKWSPSLPQCDGLYHGFGLSAVGEIIGLTGIADPNLTEDGILIYPNPAREELNIIVPVLEGQSVQITNIHGQKLYSGTINEYHTKLDIRQFEKGVYFVMIISDKHNWVEKVVVE